MAGLSGSQKFQVREVVGAKSGEHVWSAWLGVKEDLKSSEYGYLLAHIAARSPVQEVREEALGILASFSQTPEQQRAIAV